MIISINETRVYTTKITPKHVFREGFFESVLYSTANLNVRLNEELLYTFLKFAAKYYQNKQTLSC